MNTAASRTPVRLPFQPGATAVLLCGVALAAIGFAASPQGGTTPPPTQASQSVPVLGGSATADSNQRMVAVTGVDVTGASVLYLIDTVMMRLCVYQASSTGGNQGVRFVGARRIELDVELNGYNDRSQYNYAALLEEFEKKKLVSPAGASGASEDVGSPQVPAGGSSDKRP